MRERVRGSFAGIPVLLLLLSVALANAYTLVTALRQQDVVTVGMSVLAALVLFFLLSGLFTVQPNQSRVLQLFGRYVGTVRQEGLRWVNPFYSGRVVSMRVRSFDGDRLKVNDVDGNPIEIAAVIVWKVVDSAQALFDVEDFEKFTRIQAEGALRNLATHYPYDSHIEGEVSLRGSTQVIADRLKHEVQDRLTSSGVAIVEARISHLAYAPEIAHAMLQRQQAGAIIAARQRIVDGAVGMVEMALEKLSQQKLVHLDEERKAQMVCNLLVVLCSERATQPVVNAGSLY